MSNATLRLKMSISSLKKVADNEGNVSAEEITLSCVYGKEGTANAQWSKWTPSGQLTFTVNNPDAFGKVLPGQFFFVDLVPTDKEGI